MMHQGMETPTETQATIPPCKDEPETAKEPPVPTENQENEPPRPRELESEDSTIHTIRHQLPVIMMTGPSDHEKVAINLSFYQTAEPEQRLPTVDYRPTNDLTSAPCSDPPEPPASGHQQDQIPPFSSGHQQEQITAPPLGHQQEQIPPYVLEDITQDVVRRRRRGRQYPGRSPIRRPALRTAYGLAGVSAWRGGLMSQRSRDMLLASAVTTAGLWVIVITLATCYAVMK